MSLRSLLMTFLGFAVGRALAHEEWIVAACCGGAVAAYLVLQALEARMLRKALSLMPE